MNDLASPIASDPPFALATSCNAHNHVMEPVQWYDGSVQLMQQPAAQHNVPTLIEPNNSTIRYQNTNSFASNRPDMFTASERPLQQIQQIQLFNQTQTDMTFVPSLAHELTQPQWYQEPEQQFAQVSQALAPDAPVRYDQSNDFCLNHPELADSANRHMQQVQLFNTLPSCESNNSTIRYQNTNSFASNRPDMFTATDRPLQQIQQIQLFNQTQTDPSFVPSLGHDLGQPQWYQEPAQQFAQISQPLAADAPVRYDQGNDFCLNNQELTNSNNRPIQQVQLFDTTLPSATFNTLDELTIKRESLSGRDEGSFIGINNQHTCDLCGKSGFSTKGNLKRHLRAHSGEKPFKCEQCGSCFTEKKSLKIHVRRHTGEKPYKCQVCGKPFSQTGVLQSHMALHYNERKFDCQRCGKAFRQRSQLKLHLMRHDGVKRLECSTCMAKFLTKGDLERHCRIHTGERPYACKICNKTFTRQQSLNEHMNRHTGRKPYDCKFCDKTFSEMSACYKHAKVHKKQDQISMPQQNQPLATNVPTETIQQILN